MVKVLICGSPDEKYVKILEEQMMQSPGIRELKIRIWNRKNLYVGEQPEKMIIVDFASFRREDLPEILRREDQYAIVADLGNLDDVASDYDHMTPHESAQIHKAYDYWYNLDDLLPNGRNRTHRTLRDDLEAQGILEEEDFYTEDKQGIKFTNKQAREGLRRDLYRLIAKDMERTVCEPRLLDDDTILIRLDRKAPENPNQETIRQGYHIGPNHPQYEHYKSLVNPA